MDTVATFGGILAALLHAWWVLGLAAAAAIGFRIVLIATAPLRVVSVGEVRRRRRTTLLFVMILVVAIILVGLYDTFVGSPR